jgi:hypothetical protein
MAATVHTIEQGKRVHYLANLGGLVAIAGLEQYDPELLLGVLCEVAQRLPQLADHRHAELREKGRARLAARGAEKRAWTAWQQAQHLHQVVLTTDQVHRLIRLLGGLPPQHVEELVSVLTTLVRGGGDGAD